MTDNPVELQDAIERVARALCQVTAADPDAIGIDGKPRWKGWCQYARAAIAALSVSGDMREARYGGDAGDAVDWALDHMPKRDDLRDFLEAWREDNLRDYADYLRWVRLQQTCAAESRAALSSQTPPER